MWGFKGFPTMDARLQRWVLAAEDICFKNSLLSYLFRLGLFLSTFPSFLLEKYLPFTVTYRPNFLQSTSVSNLVVYVDMNNKVSWGGIRRGRYGLVCASSEVTERRERRYRGCYRVLQLFRRYYPCYMGVMIFHFFPSCFVTGLFPIHI